MPPTIGALCGGRLAKAKGVRYGPPTNARLLQHTRWGRLARQSSRCTGSAIRVRVMVRVELLDSRVAQRDVPAKFVTFPLLI